MDMFINKVRSLIQDLKTDDRAKPPIGKVKFGDFRRLEPISRSFGFDRGTPLDRYYIENFLQEQSSDIQGHVLEIGDDHYTRQFGGAKVRQSDVLDITAKNPHATIIADLANAGHLPSHQFDCIIFTQTLQFIYNLSNAIATLHRILKPRGVLLSTFPVISQICRYDMDRWGDYWRFTDASVQNLLGDHFGHENVTANAHGNILVAMCFLHGLSVQELEPFELDHHDPDYQILITARAIRI
jgi:SAM-dependent methyltransferase